jgi:hypothetical protein
VNASHAWYRLTQADGNPLRGVLPYAIKLLIASGLSAVAMIGASLLLNLGEASRDADRVQLLIRTPIAGLFGLAVLAVVMYLLAGREIAGWRTVLRRRPRPSPPPDSAGQASPPEDRLTEPGSAGDAEADADATDGGTREPENTAIAANLP